MGKGSDASASRARVVNASRIPGTATPPPSADEWRRLEPLIDAVLAASPDRRPTLLAELCGGDVCRQAELERLVAECEQAYPLLELPAADRFSAILDDDTPLLPELFAGRYRVLREAGRGGMAIVYVARDLKHGRDVAVKALRPELTAVLGRKRFLREIEIAARLRHPNVVPLYDSGEIHADPADGEGATAGSSILYYVMPYEAGHSLRERLERDGPLPIDDAVRILRDICEALAHAHQHGIVHLDIKPDNVLLAGRHAMVTDFGVARAVSEATVEPTLGLSGIALGTAAYMAPEQAANDPLVDHRTDIYAVGALAYELLEGSPPPPQPSDAVPLDRQLVSHRTDVPEELASLIAKCLARLPADRWQSADDLLAHLARVAASPTSPTTDRSHRTRNRTTRLAIFIGLALCAVSLTALAINLATHRNRRSALRLGRARQLTSEPGLEVQPSLSPDGRHVAYAVGRSLQMRIDVLPVGGGKPVRLTADTTKNQWLPRWSPDGTRILFLSNGGVFSVPASGGQTRAEVERRDGAIVTSATWSPDGREIAYARADSLLARTVGSGYVRLITTGADLHSCSWSPDGARLACVSGNSYYVTTGTIFGLGPMFGNLAPSRIVLIPTAGGKPVSVTDSSSLHQSPVWSRDGRTLYYVSNRQGPRDIYAVDVGMGFQSGREPVRVTTGMGVQSLDLSTDGTRVVYAVYRSTANIWAMPIPLGHTGSFTSARPVTSENQTVEGVRISPDGKWLIYDSDLSGTSAVYRVPIAGGDAERVTHGPFDAFRGALSPNGAELVYHSFQTGSRELFLEPLDGGPVRQLTRSAGGSMANWSPDGTALTFFNMNTAQVFVMRRDPSGRWGIPRVVGGPGVRPEWSPDGRTIAFVSPNDGRIRVVSADSGTQRDLYVPGANDPLAELAIFAASGRELYFKSHDEHGRASFWSIPKAGGRPHLLVRFDDPLHASNRFEFATDGKRFYFTIEDRQSDIWVADVAPHSM